MTVAQFEPVSDEGGIDHTPKTSHPRASGGARMTATPFDLEVYADRYSRLKNSSISNHLKMPPKKTPSTIGQTGKPNASNLRKNRTVTATNLHALPRSSNWIGPSFAVEVMPRDRRHPDHTDKNNLTAS
jgi:hypothetical protein